MVSDPHEGMCSACGFLSKRTESRGGVTQTYYETTHNERASADLFTHSPDKFTGPVDSLPFCFRNAASLTTELGQISTANESLSTQQAMQRVIRKDRKCPKWYPYTPDYSPKEHLEEFKMLELERRREEHDLKLFEMAQDIQDRREAVAKRNEKFIKMATVFFIVVGFAEIAGLAASLLAPDGWLWLMELLRIDIGGTSMPSTLDTLGSQTQSAVEQSP